MQTSFSLRQLADPDTAVAEKILRTCVHCGLCTATCPTYLLLGDEADSPRGRIYLIKDMLENGRPATRETAKHIDRCLSCLSCMTTCPSGVHYMHLVDHARAHIEHTYKRPLADRMLRAVLAKVLPNRGMFKAALALASMGKLARPLLAALPAVGSRLAAMVDLAPSGPPAPVARNYAPAGGKRGRVILMEGCAQPVLQPSINAAAHFLLAASGIEVVTAAREGCCGALTHHMGKEEAARAAARANIDVWCAEMEKAPVDAVLITASGCGTTVKDYGFMFRNDPAYAQKASAISALAKDVSEYLSGLDLPAPQKQPGLTLAYHSACSMQHGQQIREEPKRLLQRAGFMVRDIPESHICCGSAGTYNLLQPEIAGRLRARKLANIARVRPQAIATGNVGCITQLAQGAGVPVLHTVELLAWVHGGPVPPALERAGFPPQSVA
ncbi:MAG: glycolate oxidase subunit GlcF [Beijerinckiaceae bacterium]